MNRHKDPSWGSFTLVELIIVVAIIITLSSLEVTERFLSPKETELIISLYIFKKTKKQIAEEMGVSPSWITQWSQTVLRKLVENPELRKMPNIKEALTELVGGQRRFRKLFPDWPASDLQAGSRKASTTKSRKLS